MVVIVVVVVVIAVAVAAAAAAAVLVVVVIIIIIKIIETFIIEKELKSTAFLFGEHYTEFKAIVIKNKFYLQLQIDLKTWTELKVY